MWLIICTCTIISVCIYVLSKSGTRKSLPRNVEPLPIERGWPIVGVIPSINTSLYDYFWRLSKKLGPIFEVKFGLKSLVVLNNYDWFKKCLKDDADNFSGRYMNNLVHSISHNSGILFQEGAKWQKSRSFTMRVLKDFGLGRSKSEEIVQAELDLLLERLVSANGNSVDFGKLISMCTLNIISKFLMNKRFEEDNEKINFLKYVIEETLVLRDPCQMMLIMFPALNRSRLFCALTKYMFKHTKSFVKVHQIFLDEIEEHRRHIDVISEGEDLIDRFLLEQKLQQSSDHDGAFSEWQLVRVLFELFVAGYETTSTTLVWSMLLLARHPGVQEEMCEEIDRRLGGETRVKLAHKRDLPFCAAVMDEIARMAAVAPVALFHRTLNSNSTVGGRYYIPADTMVVPNIFACLRDPLVWERPHDFFPGHVLKKPHTLASEAEYYPREELVVFGMGRRQCLGESLARLEFFVFLVGILQRFRVEFARDISDSEYDKVIRGPDAVIRSCGITDFKFTIR